jgi:uncharacterized membrane protein YhiD involved in acid resistance
MRRPSLPAWFCALLTAMMLSVMTAPLVAQTEALAGETANALATPLEELRAAAIRLPLAALLGMILALRPRRSDVGERKMSVVETQIILAIVGALIMLVVGASLARAFGIVGAANLIRYRAKIDDPKDAVVMLSALAIGLASGVGLYSLAVFGTFFIGAVLWVIEGFEPKVNKRFDLTVKAKDGVGDLRPRIEALLTRFHAAFELRASAADLVSYAITAPANLRLDRVSHGLTALGGDNEISVEWEEKKPMKQEAA